MLVIDKTCLGLIISYLLFSPFFLEVLTFSCGISTNISFNNKNILATCLITANIHLWNALSLCGRLRNWFKSVHLSGHTHTYIKKYCYSTKKHFNQQQSGSDKFIFSYLPNRSYCFVKVLARNLPRKYCKRTLLNVIITATVCSANRWWVSSVSVSDSTSIYYQSRTQHFTFITL